MYEIKKNVKEVNGINICTYSREITDSFNLEVEAGIGVGPTYTTSDPVKTYIRIENKGGNVMGNKLENLNNFSVRPYNNGVEIVINGVNGLEAITRALKFAFRVLKDGSENKNY